MLMPLARNRPPQALIGMNLALGLGLIVIRLLPQARSIRFTTPSSATLLAMPLMLSYWASIGMRASFFVPSVLPASWTFRANAPSAATGYALGTRAAMIAVVGVSAAALAAVAGAFVGGWQVAVRHAVISALTIVILCDVLVLTIADLPYTRAYEPGHANLKTRWPLYLGGAYLVSDGIVKLEQVASRAGSGLVILALAAVIVVAALEYPIRRKGRTWTVTREQELEPDFFSVITLDLSTPTQASRATQLS